MNKLKAVFAKYILPLALILLVSIGILYENERLLNLEAEPVAKNRHAEKQHEEEHMDGAEELHVLRSFGLIK